jgi:PPOX class probable F420-dependent enzyme
MMLKPRVEERLGDTHLIWLTTVTPGGVPQPSLVWFWWDGESFLVYSQPDRPKLANISSNASVALNLDAMARGAEEVTVIQGSAVIDASAPPVVDHAEYLARYRGLIEDDLGMTVEEFSATYSVPIRVTPTSTRVW